MVASSRCETTSESRDSRSEAQSKGKERAAMIYKRGKTYWYKFMWQGRLVRESTKQGNDKVARSMESAHRTSLAKGEVGIREKKPAPVLSNFLAQRFGPWAKARFENNVRNTWEWYRTAMRAIE